MTTIRRRAVIAAVPALAIPAGAMATIQYVTGSDAELVSLEAEFNAIRDAFNNHPGDISDAEGDAYFDRLDAVGDRIVETPASGLDGIMVKYRHAQYWQELGAGDYTGRAFDALGDALTAVLGRAP